MTIAPKRPATPLINLLVSFLLLTSVVAADVRLPKILSSHMVLQRNAEVLLWGWADPGEEVSVKADWLSKPVNVMADSDGEWRVGISTGNDRSSHSISVSGKNSIELSDVLFGEVWIGSGQSNMKMPVVPVSKAYTGIKDYDKEVANASHPQIRLFQVGNLKSIKPIDDVAFGVSNHGVPISKCEWSPCSPDTVKTFAATAYFFARKLHQELNVPIGIIDSAWGGTSAELWTPVDKLKELGYTEKERAKGSKLYNGMIHPLLNFKIKGCIWYQGESNVSKADRYRKLFTGMIQSWREGFKNEMPFYYVQISPFNYKNKMNSAYLREAQFETLAFPNTGMVVTNDIANLKDIHPKNKQEVGRRLALLALARDYGKDIVASGPLYQGYLIEDAKIRIRFTKIGNGLSTRDDKAPSHFTIAGKDRVFHPAVASITNDDEVVVYSEEVSDPAAVRFAFDNISVPNLMNKEGLPATSFRTDTW